MKLAEEMCELSKHAEDNRKKEYKKNILERIRHCARFGGKSITLSLGTTGCFTEIGLIDPIGFPEKYWEYVLDQLRLEGFKVVIKEYPELVYKEKEPSHWIPFSGKVRTEIIPGYKTVTISWCCKDNT